MSWEIVGFYTPSYKEYADKFLESARNVGIKNVNLTSIEDEGSWLKNVFYQPFFIQESLESTLFDAIIYMDLDDEFFKYPSLFDSINSDVGITPQFFHPSYLSISPLYLRKCDYSFKFMSALLHYAYIVVEDMKKGHIQKKTRYIEVAMEYLMREISRRLKRVSVDTFPATYTNTWYPGMGNILEPDINETVIRGYVASRSMKENFEEEFDTFMAVNPYEKYKVEEWL